MNDRTLDLAGMRTRIHERGAGPCVLFVHGLGGDLHSWDRLWPLLPKDRRSVRYDLRGFGAATAKSDESFSHGEDIGALLDALAIDRCHLIGVSMGGGIALNFALDHPERVASLVLISPQILGWEWSEQWRESWRVITDAARIGDMDEARRLWWNHPMFAATRASAAAGDLAEETRRFAGTQWLEDRQAPVMPDVERLHTLQPPTLLLSGQQDVEELRLMADILAASAGDMLRVDLAGGHLLHMELPEQCARHIADFHAAHFPA